MKSKVLTPIFVTVAIIGLIAWKLTENKQIIDRNAELSLTINTIVPVMVENPQYMDFNEKITVNGRIDSKNEVAVHSKAQGVVIKKIKKTGDVVSQNLVSIGAITVRELEDVQIALRGIESRITELKEQLSNTSIVSPVAGIINKNYFEEGTLLTIGSYVADIVDNKTLKMYINVTEKEVLKLKKGDEATITTDVYSGSTFTGIIDAISPKSNDQYYYSVELRVNNPQLQPGMFATAIFNIDKSSLKTLAISRDAIVGGLKAPHVFVVKDGKAYKIPVQVGISDGEYIEITDGVSTTDIIVKSGQINLVDDTEVSIIN